MGLFPTPFLKKIEPSIELMRMDYLRKGARSLEIEQPALSRPLSWLMPANARFTTVAPPPPQRIQPPAGDRVKLVPTPDKRPGAKGPVYRPGPQAEPGHRPNLPPVPKIPPGAAKKGGAS
jgi:hypothetical protein